VIEPESGPFLFDTSAQSYLSSSSSATEQQWMTAYSRLFPVHVSVITVIERMRGYSLATSRGEATLAGVMGKTAEIYLASLRSTEVLPLTLGVAPVAAQLMALFPNTPTPPRRSHRLAESRQDRISRWRFDIMIAATALVHDMPLIHNNPQDFEPMRALIETVPERFPGVGPLNLISVKRLAA
jgi:predicted nucleic acid-binding protein